MLKKLLILSLATVALSACEVKDAVQSVNNMPGKLDQTNQQMSQLSHDQTLLLTTQEMAKPENQEKLSPLPSALMPYAKKFAETAYEDELLDYIYLKIREIEEVNPSNGTDANGNDIPLTADQLHALSISKNGTLYSLFIISGYIPDAMMANIVQHQVYGRGRYQGLTMNILMMRVIFWRDLMLDSDLLEKPLANAEAMDEAIHRLNKIEYVLELPFVSQVSLNVKDGVYKLVDVSDSLTASGSLAPTEGEWKKAYNNALSSAQSYQKQSLTGNPQQDEAAYKAEQAEQIQALSVMKKYSDKWSATAP
jgi:hypothetical protein